MSQAQPAIVPLKTIKELKPNTFIYEQQHALSAELCEEMIRRFEASEEDQYQGRIGQTVSKDRGIKKTTDHN